MSSEVGDWITPSWSGHSAYGQTGQIIGVSPSGAWQVDQDGDGSADFYVQNQNMVSGGSYTHSGMLGSHAMDNATNATLLFNISVGVVLAVVGFQVIKLFLKRFRLR